MWSYESQKIINEESFQIRSIKVFVLVNFFALHTAELLWTNWIGFCMEKSLSIKFTVNFIKTTVRVPTRTGKPGKMGRHFPVREKSGNFEQTGKVRENHTKYWKTEINWDKYYLIFLVIFKWTVHFLVKWIKVSVKKNKTLKKYWKNDKKYWKRQGKVREFCQSGKVGTLTVV